MKAKRVRNSEYDKAYRRKYYAERKVELNKKRAVWGRANRERVRKSQRERYARCKDNHFWTKLRSMYDLSKEQYEKMLVDQNGVCKVCGCKDPESKRNRGRDGLSVDHCHVTGKIRGLLCTGCNIAIGQAKESPERLEKLAAYLRN